MRLSFSWPVPAARWLAFALGGLSITTGLALLVCYGFWSTCLPLPTTLSTLPSQANGGKLLQKDIGDPNCLFLVTPCPLVLVLDSVFVDDTPRDYTPVTLNEIPNEQSLDRPRKRRDGKIPTTPFSWFALSSTLTSGAII